jgi:hypothetical protein
VDHELAPVRGERLVEPPLPPLREPADVGRDTHLPRTRLLRDPPYLLDDPTAAHHQPTAPLPQPGVQRLQALHEERRPVRAHVPAAQPPVVDDDSGTTNSLSAAAVSTGLSCTRRCA